MSKPRDYLVVDLEWTCCEDGSISAAERETIEMGAVVVNAASMTNLGEFDVFVRPTRHPVLTKFCRDLTGIRQRDVDDSDSFPEAFASFRDWFGAYGDVLFCSWGNCDRDQFKQDCRYHAAPYPFKDHLNLSRLFTSKTGRRRGHRGAMKILNLEPRGDHHRGISDARNIVTMLPFLLGED